MRSGGSIDSNADATRRLASAIGSRWLCSRSHRPSAVPSDSAALPGPSLSRRDLWTGNGWSWGEADTAGRQRREISFEEFGVAGNGHRKKRF